MGISNENIINSLITLLGMQNDFFLIKKWLWIMRLKVALYLDQQACHVKIDKKIVHH